MKKLLLLLLVIASTVKQSHAQPQHTPIAACTGAASTTFLDISNVRAEILHNGDMWWGLGASSAQYEVPKGSGKYSMFAGAIWIGGLDAGGNLHMAGQNYRQSGNDFWPGPMDTTDASVNGAVCSQYDRYWKILRSEVVSFIGGGTATADMMSYPGNGTGNQAHYLAPFYDNNGDGIYNTADGDYPAFVNLGGAGSDCCNNLYGDQAIWWVINDVGNIHGETGGDPNGFEIQGESFAFLSSDSDVNNATFYHYRIINRNPALTVFNTYFGAFVDPDLGNYNDDFVGCDVKRGMGFCYNADENDEGALGYGINPPAIGLDFVQGPLADAGDGIDNNRDSVVDEPGERIIMSSFSYYTNGTPNPMQDPASGAPAEWYHYLEGLWQDGSPMHYGGNGYNSGTGLTTDSCKFAFPGSSDPYGWGTKGIIESPWSEETAGDVGGDRRFLASVGAFTMFPGSVKCITTAVPWARATSGGRLASLALLKVADDKLQFLADNCFDITAITGIAQTNATLSVSIYPNPASDNFVLSFKEPVKDALIKVYNATGALVLTQREVSGKQCTISCKGLAQGVYFVQVSDGEKKYAQKLVVE